MVMMRQRSPAWFCLLVMAMSSLAVAAPTKVHLRAKDGKWLTKPAERVPGGVRLSVNPTETGGSTLVLINRPSWMVLPDDDPPRVTRVEVTGRSVAHAENADWGVLSENPAAVVISLKDGANPLDPATVEVHVDPGEATVSVDVADLRSTRIQGQVRLRLPRLAAGRYQLRFACADRSPGANRLVRHWSFVVPGVAVSSDQQEVRLVSAGGEYTCRAKGQATIACGQGPAAYLTSRVRGEHVYVERFGEVQVLEDTPARQRVRIVAVPGKGDRGGDGAQLARLEYELETRAGLPCVLVTSRTVNLGSQDNLYCWWGWLPGARYHIAQGAMEWSNQYKDVGKVGWVYLPAPQEHDLGLGWIAPGVFGESRFGTMLLYTDPREIATPSMGHVEIRFALMTATSPEAVAATAHRLQELGLW